MITYMILLSFSPLPGFCLEKVTAPTTSKFKAAEHEERILACYERAGDLAILYVQDHEKSSQQTMSASSLSMVEVSLGPLIEQAIHQSPLCHVKNESVQLQVSLFVCVCVCVHVCVFVCVCVCMHACINVCVFMHMFVPVHVLCYSTCHGLCVFAVVFTCLHLSVYV